MDSNQGDNLYKWVIRPLNTVINLHITSYIQYPEPLSRLGGGNSNIFYLYPEKLGKMNPI